jgi:hypothetical protein
MADFFVMPATPPPTLVPTGLATAGDTNSVLFILMIALGFMTLAVVGIYMMKMMKWV